MFTFGYKTRFGSIVRSIAAIGVGLVMIFGQNATETLVKVIAWLVLAAGAVSLVYGLMKKNEGSGRVMLTNSVVDIILGLILLYNPGLIAGVIVTLIGIVLIVFGAIQLFALSGAMTLLGGGFGTLIFSIIAIVGGAFLLFSPFGMRVMSIIAGCLLLFYGISDLLSARRMEKARVEYEVHRTSSPKEPADNADGGKMDLSGISDAKEVDYEKED